MQSQIHTVYPKHVEKLQQTLSLIKNMNKVTVSIDVPNLALAESFYMQALQCKKVRNQGEKMVILAAQNIEIYLLECAPKPNPIAAKEIERTYDRHWTPVHLDFLCDDVDKILQSVKKFGGTCEGSESGTWGSIAYCADPFGNGFCLIKE